MRTRSRREALDAARDALMGAADAPGVLQALARGAWHARLPWRGRPCPTDMIPAPEALQAWLKDCPPERLMAAWKRWPRGTGQDPAPRLAMAVWAGAGPAAGKFSRSGTRDSLTVDSPAFKAVFPGWSLGPDVEALQAAWLALPEADRGRHPLGPLVGAWQVRPVRIEAARVVAVGGQRQSFTKLTGGAVTAALHERTGGQALSDAEAAAVLVDGHPVATRAGGLKAYRIKRQRLANGLLLAAAGPPLSVRPEDPVLYALGGLSDVDGRDPIRSDVYRVLAMSQALAGPVTAHVNELAAYLAGKPSLAGMGAYRVKRLRDRAWAAAFYASSVWVPVKGGGYRHLLSITNVRRSDAMTLDIEPYRWTSRDPWRLSGAVSGAGLWERLGPIGAQIYAALEDVIAASGKYSRRRRTPRLLVPTRKGGPGQYEIIHAESLMARAGLDVSGGLQSSPKARRQWMRFKDKAAAAGLLVPDGNLSRQSEAARQGLAGVEIVDFRKGRKGHTAKVLARASAARVEAQRLAESRRKGRAFDLLRLSDLAGLKPSR